ncbi:type III secretion inner membrane ring lipoprotein SctJ [Paraburkholderia sp. D15]|uniref:type III secretion system inner membrane ring lipoprotein SctJ n=1 Tax=Paraburkholderia sp. D15 TaxID=2880218 RepID=UPI0024795BA7|nr:type III secretion inner membrane ring lipoprotein SctJ [Paraburkholderia sp. D15]WGS54763.1 type III secretion inner membrane ring lipoprotein SctJ [Paraburkholderia sp. D15]
MARRRLRESHAARRAGLALLLAGCALLASCKKELYANLSEQDVNEMTVALLERGVNADKVSPDGGKTYTLQVEGNDMVRAMQILSVRGLPHSKFDDLGNLFKKDGLVSTPTEERVRFIYGLSQELSGTLSHIDGVMFARVQIVLPNNDPLAQQVKPSSAAVFIKYRPESDIGALVPQIKNLVVHSVEGLSYDQVSVTAVAAEPVEIAAAAPEQPYPLRWVAGSVAALLLVLAGAAVARRKALQRRFKPAADVLSGRFAGLAAMRRKRGSSA